MRRTNAFAAMMGDKMVMRPFTKLLWTIVHYSTATKQLNTDNAIDCSICRKLIKDTKDNTHKNWERMNERFILVWVHPWCNWIKNIRWTVVTTQTEWLRSTVMSMSVCLSVCPLGYLRNRTRDLYHMLPTAVARSSPAERRNPKRKGQFWGFSSPLTMHYTA